MLDIKRTTRTYSILILFGQLFFHHVQNSIFCPLDRKGHFPSRLFASKIKLPVHAWQSKKMSHCRSVIKFEFRELLLGAIINGKKTTWPLVNTSGFQLLNAFVQEDSFRINNAWCFSFSYKSSSISVLNCK